MKAGKTTTCAALAGRFDIPIRSFAGPLKRSAEELGIVVNGPAKDRVFLQDFGAWLTGRDDEFFVKLLDQFTPQRAETGLLIDDLRRRCEFVWCRRNDFVLIKLEVSPETQVARGAEPERLDHSTETALDFLDDSMWDLIVEEGLTSEQVVDGITYYLTHEDHETAFNVAATCYLTPDSTSPDGWAINSI